VYRDAEHQKKNKKEKKETCLSLAQLEKLINKYV
jgi:hypothetical protein